MIRPRASTILRAPLMALGSALLLAAALWGAAAPIAAQGVEELKQIALTDKLVAGFIAAQTDLQPLSARLLEGGDRQDDKLRAELDEIAKKNGFDDFMHMETVGANISLVLDGLDRTTGAYTDPVEKMKLELENIKADASIPDEDKTLVIEDLNQEIAAARPLAFKENIEVVKRHQAELEKFTADSAGESMPEDAAPSAEPGKQ